MNIICPKCQKENKIVVPGGANCKHCNKSLDGYKFIKPLFPALLLIAMGVGGAQTYEHFTDKPRYPVKYEYGLVDKCISSYNQALPYVSFKDKRDSCLCAVEKTQKEMSFSEFMENQEKFMTLFSIAALDCKN